LTDNLNEASSVDEPHRGLPAPVNDLVVTVLAPAAALSHADGQIRATGMDGLFVSDVRALTEVRLRFGGAEPHPLTAAQAGPGRTRFIAVAHGFGDPINDPTIRIDRTRQVAPDGMSEEIRILSAATRPVRAWLTIDLRCDLTPLDAAKTGQSSPDLAASEGPSGLVWDTPDITVEASGAGADVTANPPTLSWFVELAPGAEQVVTWRVGIRERVPVLTAPAGPVEWTRPAVRGDDPRLERLLARSLDDLESLRLTDAGAEPGSTFVGAGAPWFLTLFGRDSIWAARMLLPLGTGLAEGTLRTLARRQGSTVDPNSGEAPGKIMHELRHDDRRLGSAGLKAPPGFPATYYGTIDATLLWISLLADAWRWGMAESVVVDLLPNLRRALSWLELHGDPDGDGFLEYIDATGRGLANQGWKDSFNAIRFHDGHLGQPPIALCEVQAYAHRAALDAAAMLDAFDGPASQGERWRTYAAELADRFRARFWVDGQLGPFPALAIDGDGRPVDSLTSNIGHLLGTGLLNQAEEARVAQLLSAPPLSAGYGVRTMSTLDKGYSSLSYHCGSIWPHDTAIALLGLTAVGADAAAEGLVSRLLAAAEAFDFRLPELYGGDATTDLGRPVPHPAACRPQAWAAAAAVSVLQATLGLTVDVPRGEVRARPLSVLGAVEVTGLRIAGQRVGVSVDRAGNASASGLPGHIRWVPDRPVGALLDPAAPLDAATLNP
jgi:glycogen debranching enzyme